MVNFQSYALPAESALFASLFSIDSSVTAYPHR